MFFVKYLILSPTGRSDINPHVGFIAAMGARGRPFGLVSVFVVMGFSLRAVVAFKSFQGTGYHHFGFIAAVFTFTDLFDGFYLFIHTILLPASMLVNLSIIQLKP